MPKSEECCSHCGTKGGDLKRCSRCKLACYCGAACQKASWKLHKNKCTPAESRDEVLRKVQAALAASDFHGALKWEGRMDEMMEGRTDEACAAILERFTMAHMHLVMAGDTDHVPDVVRLEGRRVEFLGKLQRFRDQGQAFCNIAQHLLCFNDTEQAARCSGSLGTHRDPHCRDLGFRVQGRVAAAPPPTPPRLEAQGERHFRSHSASQLGERERDLY